MKTRGMFDWDATPRASRQTARAVLGVMPEAVVSVSRPRHSSSSLATMVEDWAQRTQRQLPQRPHPHSPFLAALSPTTALDALPSQAHAHASLSIAPKAPIPNRNLSLQSHPTLADSQDSCVHSWVLEQCTLTVEGRRFPEDQVVRIGKSRGG